MKRFSYFGPRVGALFLVCTPLPLNSARATVDFTPRYVDISIEGYLSKVLSVRRDANTVFLTPPPDWAVSGHPARMTLICAQLPLAKIEFGAPSQPLPPGDFDARWIEETRQRLLKSLPKEALDAKVEVRPQALSTPGAKSHEFIVDYNYFGDRLQKSLCVIRMRGEAMELTTQARKGNFGQVRDLAFDMVGSWSMPPPSYVERILRR